MKKSRPFVLIEVLIAIALLALCLIPIATAPFRQFVKQTNALKEMELERISDIVYRDFLTVLPSLATFDTLPKTKEESFVHELGPYAITIGKDSHYHYIAKIRYWMKRPKEPITHALLRIEIEFAGTSQKFSYDLFIEKIT
jgi:hypothetical protein